MGYISLFWHAQAADARRIISVGYPVTSRITLYRPLAGSIDRFVALNHAAFRPGKRGVCAIWPTTKNVFRIPADFAA
jgi:hypothetical protein